eukprot:681554_1
MATCLSVGSKKKRKNKVIKVSNPYMKINGAHDRNIQHEMEEYEWMQQQKVLISRAHTKPTQYVILSQKEIHDTIEKTLNKYPQPNIHWHWVHDRFEPVMMNDSIAPSTTHTHDHETYTHNHTNHDHHPHEDDMFNQNHNLMRMNGNVVPKCTRCFRWNMKSEYMTQNDILYLIKYALKLFIEYRTRYKHSCLWRQMMDHSTNDEMVRFHSNFKYCKPLIPNMNPPQVIASASAPPVHHPHVDMAMDGEWMEQSITQCTNTTTHLNNNKTIKDKEKEKEQENYFVPRQYQSVSTSDVRDKKSKKKAKKKELKRELNAIRDNYHSMLKDYNKLQNFLSRKGIDYDAQKESQENHLNDPHSQSINSNMRNLDSLQSENERLWIELERIRQDKREMEQKYILSHNEQMRLATQNIELKSQIKALQEELHSNNTASSSIVCVYEDEDDNDNEEDMIQRIFDSTCDNSSDNNDFYLALTTLYEIKYDDDEEDEDDSKESQLQTMKLNGFVRKRACSSVDIVTQLRLKEDRVLSNECALFALLIGDGVSDLVDYVSSSQFDVDCLCQFLPLILFKTSEYEKEIGDTDTTLYSFLLISRLSKRSDLRAAAYHDIAQKLVFLAHSYCDDPFAHLLFTNSYKIWTNQFDVARASDECISFWRSLFWLPIGRVCLAPNESFRDPVLPSQAPMRGVRVRRELSSANKPILCEILCGDALDVSSHIIIKKGDDLRKDYGMISIFKFMNYIWKKEQQQQSERFEHLSFGGSCVKILTFGVQAFTPNIGGIQLIGDCVALRHVSAANLAQNMLRQHFDELITSAAASYIGSFVCGVRDRHFENILIRVADCTLFHIDFGYCCGETIKFSLDASPFGITAALRDLMNTNENLYCDKFIPCCCDCFMALRHNHKSLIKFAQLALTKVKKPNEIQTFIKMRLKIDQKNKKWNQPQFVRKWLTKQLMTEPKCNKTRTKNKIRKFLSPTMIDLDKKLNLI